MLPLRPGMLKQINILKRKKRNRSEGYAWKGAGCVLGKQIVKHGRRSWVMGEVNWKGGVSQILGCFLKLCCISSAELACYSADIGEQTEV